MKYIVLIILFSSQTLSQNYVSSTLNQLENTFHNVRDFTPYKDEAYFSAQSTQGDVSVIIKVNKINNKWTKPSIASFSGQFHDIEPFISIDGLKLYFASKRPKNKEEQAKDYDIWYVKRKTLQSKWSMPINMGNVINSDKNEFYPSLSSNGNLYFTANYDDSKGKDDIYFSQLIDGVYQTPYSLPKSINSAGEEYNAFIAPDESYLIFGAYKREDGLGSGDLYISHKNKDGVWLKAKNMGADINSKSMDYCPYVRDGLLYFTSRRNELPQTQYNKLDDLLKTINSTKNGMSRIYKIHFKANNRNKIMNIQKETKAQISKPTLGHFSLSLSVKDIKASYEFYQKLGFEKLDGDINQNWLVLQNGTAKIGLFQGMFSQNTITFSPPDARSIHQSLSAHGAEFIMSNGIEKEKGPASFMLNDPDGNPILIDQH